MLSMSLFYCEQCEGIPLSHYCIPCQISFCVSCFNIHRDVCLNTKSIILTGG